MILGEEIRSAINDHRRGHDVRKTLMQNLLDFFQISGFH